MKSLRKAGLAPGSQHSWDKKIPEVWQCSTMSSQVTEELTVAQLVRAQARNCCPSSKTALGKEGESQPWDLHSHRKAHSGDKVPWDTHHHLTWSRTQGRANKHPLLLAPFFIPCIWHFHSEYKQNRRYWNLICMFVIPVTPEGGGKETCKTGWKLPNVLSPSQASLGLPSWFCLACPHYHNSHIVLRWLLCACLSPPTRNCV